MVRTPTAGDTAGDDATGAAARPTLGDRRARLRARMVRLRARHPRLDHLSRCTERYFTQRGNHFAAAITFFSVLTSVPLLMLAFAAAGYLLVLFPALLDTLEREIAAALPAGLDEVVEPLVAAAIQQRNTVATLGLIGAVWTGIYWMSNLREAISAQWALAAVKPTSLRRIGTDLGALVGLGLILLASLAVTAITTGFVDRVLELLGLAETGWTPAIFYTLGAVLGLLADWLVFIWAIAWLPRTRVPTRRVLGPAAFGAVGFELLKQGMGSYLTSISGTGSGAVFGSLFGALLFGYLAARFLLLVTAWAATADGTEPPPPVPVAPRVVRIIEPSPSPAAPLVLATLAGLFAGLLLRPRR